MKLNKFTTALFLFLLIIPLTFSVDTPVSSNTTYSCIGTNTLLKNTTYADRTTNQEKIQCTNGCHEGYCVNVSESKGMLNLNVLLLLVFAGLSFVVSRYNKSKTFKYSFIFFGFLLIGLSLLLVGLYSKSIPNPLFHFVGGISFNIASLFIIFITLASAGVITINWFNEKKAREDW